MVISGLHPEQPLFDHEKARNGEKIAQQEFIKDPYGCGLDPTDKTLVNKRLVRNPFKRTVPYLTACPEIVNLLNWCGPELFDSSLLPWGSLLRTTTTGEESIPTSISNTSPSPTPEI